MEERPSMGVTVIKKVGRPKEDIPMYQCALCKAQFHFVNDLVRHVENGEHLDGNQDNSLSSNYSAAGDHKLFCNGQRHFQRFSEEVHPVGVRSDEEGAVLGSNVEMILGLPLPRDLDQNNDKYKSDKDEKVMHNFVIKNEDWTREEGNQEDEDDNVGNAEGVRPAETRGSKFASDILIETLKGCHRCRICQKTCAAKSDMQKHVRRHTDERPWKCDVCGERFKHKNGITNHARIHSGERPFSCMYCNKVFTQISNMRRHEALHRGEKPFLCILCDKRFSEKTTLQTHMLQHTGERPFECEACGKGHITKSALKRHKCSQKRLKNNRKLRKNAIDCTKSGTDSSSSQ